MLTKDLIKYSTYNGKIKPRFINEKDTILLRLAEQLINQYQNGMKTTRSELEENVKPIVTIFRDLKLAKGFNKLLLDRCEFTHLENLDFIDLRKNIFTESAKLLKGNKLNDEKSYRTSVLNNINDNPELLELIYSDLPENESLIKFKPISSHFLLKRYNCALVQSLLLYAFELKLVIEEPDISKVRRLFKYLKFFRLLARIYKVENSARLKILIDGPMSLFENTQKYGLQLASFFPAICDMNKWKIETDIKFKNQTFSFVLDYKSKIQGHYRNFGAYIPEEIVLFHKNFKEKITDWEITGNTPFIDIGDQKIIFPDLSFQNKEGKIIHLELFHRWHTNQLIERLKFLNKNIDTPLIIGVDRFLYKQPMIEEEISKFSWFENKCFLFNDFPIVSSAYKCLQNQLNY